MINQPLVNTISLYNWQDRKYVQAWDKNVVISAKATTITPILRNLSRCTPKFRSYFDEYQASNYLQNTPIGNIGSPNHMFHSMPIHWGFTLDEPRLTKGLSHFLNQSADACWLFLKALFKVQRTPGENLKKHALGFRESINNKGGTQFSRSYAVVAEKPIQIDKTNKRIDLVISWTDAQQEKNWIVIECKFGHVITNNQLPAYQRYMATLSGKKYYFVVAQHVDKSSAKKLNNAQNRKHWRYAEWLPLLRCWESYLTTSSSSQAEIEDFSRFRRTLWHKATNT